MSDDKIQIIRVPASTFEFGDKQFRALYGPENDTGGRQLAGFIDEQYVELLEGLLETADAQPKVEVGK